MMSDQRRRRSPESSRRRRKARRDSREQLAAEAAATFQPDHEPIRMRNNPIPTQPEHEPIRMRSNPITIQTEPSTMRTRGRGDSSSSYSSSSSSWLDISRRYPKRGGIFRTFFSPSEHRRLYQRKKKKKATRFLGLGGNSSSSSVNSDLAYGTGFIRKPKSRGPLSPNEGPVPVGEDGRPVPPRRRQTDEEIIEIGRQLAKVARDQNREDLRVLGRRPPSQFESAVTHIKKFSRQNTGESLGRGIGSSRPHRGSDDDDSEWESASEDESDSDFDPGLAYGGSTLSLAASKPPQVISQKPPEGIRPPDRKSSVVDPKMFGPVNSLRGLINTPCGFPDGNQPGARPSTQQFAPAMTPVAPVDSASIEARPMRRVYPVPTSNPAEFDARGSTVSALQDFPTVPRPDPVPIQAPKPIQPVPARVFEEERYRDLEQRESRGSRRQAEGKSFVQDAAIGAAIAGVGAAVIADRKEKRDDRRDREDPRDRDERRMRELEREIEKRERELLERRRSERDGERRDKDSRRSKRDSVKIIDEREGKRSGRDDRRDERQSNKKDSEKDVDPERERRRREREREREGEHTRDKDREKRRSDIVVEYDRDPRTRTKGDRKEDRKEGRKDVRQDARSVSQPSEPPVDDYRRVEDPTIPATKAPIDPFQFQVDDDAFQTPTFGTTPARPLTPNVVTVEREPDFSRTSDGDRRMSRKDSFEEELRNTSHVVEETSHSTAPIAAAAMAAAVAAVEHEEQHHVTRGRDTHPRSSRDTTSKEEKDPVQAEADRYYRELVLARHAEEERSRSNSPERSVVEKWRDDENEPVVRIVTPPEMEHKHHEQGKYDAPNADVRIDNTIVPKELVKFRPPPSETRDSSLPLAVFKSRDPSCERERPLLNLVLPTPVPTPTPEKQDRKSAATEPAGDKYGAETSKETPEVVIGPKGEVVEIVSTPTKSVSWGENETKQYEVESPERSQEHYFEEPDPKSKPVEKPKSAPKKKTNPWGIIAAAVTGASTAAIARDDEPTKQSRQADALPDDRPKRSDSGSPPKDRTVLPKGTTTRAVQDEPDDIPPVPGPKPASPRSSQMPGAFADDLDFAARLAGGLQETGFDPNIVLDNSTYWRRDSPPGSNEPGLYQQPFAETVTDLGIYGDEHSTGPKPVPEPGHVVGEITETSVQDADTSSRSEKKKRNKQEQPATTDEDLRREIEVIEEPEDAPTAAPEPDNAQDFAKLSKKEQRERKKALKAAQLADEIQAPAAESQPDESVDAGDEERADTPSKKSKKSKKSKRSSSTWDDDEAPTPTDDRRISVPIDQFQDIGDLSHDKAADPNDEWDLPKKSKKKSKRDSTNYDSPSISEVKSEAPSEVSVESSSKKTKKSRRKSGQDYEDALKDIVDPDEDPPDKRERRRDSYKPVDRDVSSVVSDPAARYDDRYDARSNGGRYDDDDEMRSVASAPTDPDRKKRSSKTEKRSSKEEKRSSGGFLDFFKSDGSKNETTKSKDSKKEQSFLDNAGTRGESVGLVGAIAGLAALGSHLNATEALSDKEQTNVDLGQISRPVTPNQDVSVVDPDIVHRVIKPAIDPQYGDLLPLPPSEPGSPHREPENLPTLPDSRPATPPEQERALLREKLHTHMRRRSAYETPSKSPSSTAIPIQFRMGHQRSVPPSPGVVRSSPIPSPSILATPVTEFGSVPKKLSRPSSWDTSREIKPLILLEQAGWAGSQSRDDDLDLSDLPPLPPSRESPGPEFEVREGDIAYHATSHANEDAAPLRVDTSIPSIFYDAEHLGSQETTPKAEAGPQLVHPDQDVFHDSQQEIQVVAKDAVPEPSMLNQRPAYHGDEIHSLSDLPPLPPSEIASPSHEPQHSRKDVDEDLHLSSSDVDRKAVTPLETPPRNSSGGIVSPSLSPVPVEPTTKDRSSYLLHPTPPSIKREIESSETHTSPSPSPSRKGLGDLGESTPLSAVGDPAEEFLVASMGDDDGDRDRQVRGERGDISQTEEDPSSNAEIQDRSLEAGREHTATGAAQELMETQDVPADDWSSPKDLKRSKKKQRKAKAQQLLVQDDSPTREGHGVIDPSAIEHEAEERRVLQPELQDAEHIGQQSDVLVPDRHNEQAESPQPFRDEASLTQEFPVEHAEDQGINREIDESSIQDHPVVTEEAVETPSLEPFGSISKKGKKKKSKKATAWDEYESPQNDHSIPLLASEAITTDIGSTSMATDESKLPAVDFEEPRDFPDVSKESESIDTSDFAPVSTKKSKKKKGKRVSVWDSDEPVQASRLAEEHAPGDSSATGPSDIPSRSEERGPLSEDIATFGDQPRDAKEPESIDTSDFASVPNKKGKKKKKGRKFDSWESEEPSQHDPAPVGETDIPTSEAISSSPVKDAEPEPSAIPPPASDDSHGLAPELLPLQDDTSSQVRSLVASEPLDSVSQEPVDARVSTKDVSTGLDGADNQEFPEADDSHLQQTLQDDSQGPSAVVSGQSQVVSERELPGQTESGESQDEPVTNPSEETKDKGYLQSALSILPAAVGSLFGRAKPDPKAGEATGDSDNVDSTTELETHQEAGLQHRSASPITEPPTGEGSGSSAEVETGALSTEDKSVEDTPSGPSVTAVLVPDDPVPAHDSTEAALGQASITNLTPKDTPVDSKDRSVQATDDNEPSLTSHFTPGLGGDETRDLSRDQPEMETILEEPENISSGTAGEAPINWEEETATSARKKGKKGKKAKDREVKTSESLPSVPATADEHLASAADKQDDAQLSVDQPDSLRIGEPSVHQEGATESQTIDPPQDDWWPEPISSGKKSKKSKKKKGVSQPFFSEDDASNIPSLQGEIAATQAQDPQSETGTETPALADVSTGDREVEEQPTLALGGKKSKKDKKRLRASRKLSLSEDTDQPSEPQSALSTGRSSPEITERPTRLEPFEDVAREQELLEKGVEAADSGSNAQELKKGSVVDDGQSLSYVSPSESTPKDTTSGDVTGQDTESQDLSDFQFTTGRSKGKGKAKKKRASVAFDLSREESPMGTSRASEPEVQLPEEIAHQAVPEIAAESSTELAEDTQTQNGADITESEHSKSIQGESALPSASPTHQPPDEAESMSPVPRQTDEQEPSLSPSDRLHESPQVQSSIADVPSTITDPVELPAGLSGSSTGSDFANNQYTEPTSDLYEKGTELPSLPEEKPTSKDELAAIPPQDSTSGVTGDTQPEIAVTEGDELPIASPEGSQQREAALASLPDEETLTDPYPAAHSEPSSNRDEGDFQEPVKKSKKDKKKRKSKGWESLELTTDSTTPEEGIAVATEPAITQRSSDLIQRDVASDVPQVEPADATYPTESVVDSEPVQTTGKRAKKEMKRKGKADEDWEPAPEASTPKEGQTQPSASHSLTDESTDARLEEKPSEDQLAVNSLAAEPTQTTEQHQQASEREPPENPAENEPRTEEKRNTLPANEDIKLDPPLDLQEPESHKWDNLMIVPSEVSLVREPVFDRGSYQTGVVRRKEEPTDELPEENIELPSTKREQSTSREVELAQEPAPEAEQDETQASSGLDPEESIPQPDENSFAFDRTKKGKKKKKGKRTSVTWSEPASGVQTPVTDQPSDLSRSLQEESGAIKPTENIITSEANAPNIDNSAPSESILPKPELEKRVDAGEDTVIVAGGKVAEPAAFVEPTAISTSEPAPELDLAPPPIGLQSDQSELHEPTPALEAVENIAEPNASPPIEVATTLKGEQQQTQESPVQAVEEENPTEPFVTPSELRSPGTWVEPTEETRAEEGPTSTVMDNVLSETFATPGEPIPSEPAAQFPLNASDRSPEGSLEDDPEFFMSKKDKKRKKKRENQVQLADTEPSSEIKPSLEEKAKTDSNILGENLDSSEQPSQVASDTVQDEWTQPSQSKKSKKGKKKANREPQTPVETGPPEATFPEMLVESNDIDVQQSPVSRDLHNNSEVTSLQPTGEEVSEQAATETFNRKMSKKEKRKAQKLAQSAEWEDSEPVPVVEESDKTLVDEPQVAENTAAQQHDNIDPEEMPVVGSSVALDEPDLSKDETARGSDSLTLDPAHAESTTPPVFQEPETGDFPITTRKMSKKDRKKAKALGKAESSSTSIDARDSEDLSLSATEPPILDELETEDVAVETPTQDLPNEGNEYDFGSSKKKSKRDKKRKGGKQADSRPISGVQTPATEEPIVPVPSGLTKPSDSPELVQEGDRADTTATEPDVTNADTSAEAGGDAERITSRAPVVEETRPQSPHLTESVLPAEDEQDVTPKPQVVSRSADSPDIWDDETYFKPKASEEVVNPPPEPPFDRVEIHPVVARELAASPEKKAASPVPERPIIGLGLIPRHSSILHENEGHIPKLLTMVSDSPSVESTGTPAILSPEALPHKEHIEMTDVHGRFQDGHTSEDPMEIDLTPAQHRSSISHDVPFDSSSGPEKRVKTKDLDDTPVPGFASTVPDLDPEDMDIVTPPGNDVTIPESSPRVIQRGLEEGHKDQEQKAEHLQHHDPDRSAREIAASFLDGGSHEKTHIGVDLEHPKQDTQEVFHQSISPPRISSPNAREIAASFLEHKAPMAMPAGKAEQVLHDTSSSSTPEAHPTPDAATSSSEDSHQTNVGETTRSTPSKATQSKGKSLKLDEGNETIGAGVAAGGVALLAQRFGGTKKAKGKKKQKKVLERRTSEGDDIFDDPSMWEGAERKILEGSRMDADSGNFWEGPEIAPEGDSKDLLETVEQPRDIDMVEPASPEVSEAAKTKAQSPQDTEIMKPTERPSIISARGIPDEPDNGESPVLGRPGLGEGPAFERSASPSPSSRGDRHQYTIADSTPHHSPGLTSERSPKRDLEEPILKSIEPIDVEPHVLQSPAIDFTRSLSRGLPPVQEETHEEVEPGETRIPTNQLRHPDTAGDRNRDSGFVADSPHLSRHSYHEDGQQRDSGVHLRDFPDSSPKLHDVRRFSPEPSRLSHSSVAGGERVVHREQHPAADKKSRQDHVGESDMRRHFRSSTPVLAEPAEHPRTPEPRKQQQTDTTTKQRARYPELGPAAATGAALAVGAAAASGSRSVSDNTSHSRASPQPHTLPKRSASNTSLQRHRTPEPLNLRPDSPGIRRSAAGTPPLRQKRVSGDLRSLSQLGQHSQTNLAGKETPDLTRAAQNTTPVANEGRVRSKDMADVYDGFGEGRIGSPRSPTRPHSMRRRQSMQVMELESRVDQLLAENRMLTEARAQAESHLSGRAASTLAERDAEIDSLKRTLETLRSEVDRLTEVNEGLSSANAALAVQHNDRYRQLEEQHNNSARDLHGNHSRELEEKDAEIQLLREELEATKEQIREMQRQILATKPADAEFLNLRDVDYFDHRCQQLCSHVQQWVLRFSKFSDMRACRLTREINDEKLIDRLDNAVLDGSEVDDYLNDRVRRRDIFMSMTMNMIWEFVFTRYLFGMDREQRQKLKSLEKLLLEVGPPEAVRQWRAVTLTLLARRDAFQSQRDQDTEAVVQAVFQTLSMILPPPSNLEDQIQTQLRRVMREAVELSIEMRTQKAEYMMLPPLQPKYDASGELSETVAFNASLMNERSGDDSVNEELEAAGAVVRIVLFPLVVKKGDDGGVGDDEVVVSPAQVLVARPNSSSSRRSIRMVTPSSDAGGVSLYRGGSPSTNPNRSNVTMQDAPAPEAEYIEGGI